MSMADNDLLRIGDHVSVAKVERAHIEHVLRSTKNVAHAARVLEIDQATLYRKRVRFGLYVPRTRAR